jgi:hypothetical protein
MIKEFHGLHRKVNSSIMGKTYLPLSAREEDLGREIVDAAYRVHKTLGPGLGHLRAKICYRNHSCMAHANYKSS